jgi:hypothetical protein
MEEGKEYFLADDVTGPFSKKEYGKKGDKVLLISILGDMAIAEKKNERFPVKLENISIECLLGETTETVKNKIQAPGRSKGKGTRTKTANKSLF